MKYIISEKQLANLIIKKEDVDEQVDDVSSSTSSSDKGTSPGADDKPPYPEVGKWVSGLERGSANQIDPWSKWSEVVGSKITRGHANQLK